MLRNEAPDYCIKENLCSIMTLVQCCIELQNVQGSDTTGVDSSNEDGYIITNLILTNVNSCILQNKKGCSIEQPFKILELFKPD